MKYKLLTICLAIILYGNPTLRELEIAKHYSLFVRPDIRIEVPYYDPKCEGDTNGYTLFTGTLKNLIPTKTVVCYTTDNFTRTMLHETYHNLFRSLDEEGAENYAKDLINN